MNNGKKLIWAILGGQPADSSVVRDALARPETARELMEGAALTKEELFGAEGQSVPMIANEQIWNNIQLIAQLLRAGGEELTASDFLTARGGGRPPVKYAEQFKKLDKLFTSEVWEGKMREMEIAYYSTNKLEREAQVNFLLARRAVAAAAGELTKEDRLTSYGLNPITVRTNLYNGGNLDELRATLAEHGDHIRKEYLFLLDGAGDVMFEFINCFDNFDKWLPDLEAHGERLTKEDFLFTLNEKHSALDYAVKHGKLDKVFRARIWAGHADEMVSLFETLPQLERNKVNIGAVLAELKEVEYGDRVTTDSLAALTAVMNEHERDAENFTPVQALGFARVWNDMAAVREGLAARGERLTLNDVRTATGVSGEPVLLMAARGGHIEQVMAIAADSRDVLTLADLTTDGPQGKTLLDILVDKGQVAAVLKPEHWVGRGRDLMTVWDKVPAAQKANIDFASIHGRVNMLTLRQRAQAPRPPGM